MTNSISFLATQPSEMTMSSLEIAALTGKEHFNVLVDIRKMLNELEITDLRFQVSYKDSTGRSLPCFNLPKHECMVLVTGYSIKLRSAVLRRWQELEDAQRAPAKSAYSFITSTSRERIEHEVALALEAYDVFRAVELKMGIGDHTTWTQLRVANPNVYAMQGRNGGPIPNRITKAYMAEFGKEPPKYGIDSGTSQYQGNVYPVSWLVKTVKSVLKRYYSVDVELKLPEHVTISTPALDGTIIATAELQRLGCSEH